MTKTVLLIIIAFSAIAAADVGVVVEFTDGTTYSECVRTSDGADAYDILQKTDLDLDWSGDGPYGRALCMVNGVGDDVSGDVCEWGSDYWGFSLSLNGSPWEYSPVGFTSGDCWNRDFESFDGHYCAQDGDMIGLAYGAYGSKPDSLDFEEVCLDPFQEEKKPERTILRSSQPFWERYCKTLGITFDETVPPQNLRKLGEATKAKYSEISLPSPDRVTQERTITYDYEPKVISDLSKPLRLSFYSDGYPFSGLQILINGASYVTDGDGSVSFNVLPGDYLINASLQGFKELSVIFRIGN